MSFEQTYFTLIINLKVAYYCSPNTNLNLTVFLSFSLIYAHFARQSDRTRLLSVTSLTSARYFACKEIIQKKIEIYKNFCTKEEPKNDLKKREQHFVTNFPIFSLNRHGSCHKEVHRQGPLGASSHTGPMLESCSQMLKLTRDARGI